MNIEYVSCKISKILWLNNNNNGDEPLSIENTDHVNDDQSYWLFGTYSSNGGKNFLTIYTKKNLSIIDDQQPLQQQQQTSSIVQLKNFKHSINNNNVIDLIDYDYKSSFFSLSNGQISFIQYKNYDSNDNSNNNGFELIYNLYDINLKLHKSNELLINNYKNHLISCGYDGCLLFYDINTKQLIRKSIPLTMNSLHCIDKLSDNEYIGGTTSGHLKIYDYRSNSVQLTMKNELSIITKIKRNIHNPHIVACGNDLGLLYIWDLRNNGQRPMQPLAVHLAEINDLKYVPQQCNQIITSGLDAQLIKWNITNDFEIESVETIVDRKDATILTPTYPINCFDIDYNPKNNRIIFADDNEVLYLTTF